VFYAESWALVHFLRGNELTRDRFDEYMKLAERGTPQEQALKEAFGMELPALEKALRSYVRLFRVPGEPPDRTRRRRRKPNTFIPAWRRTEAYSAGHRLRDVARAGYRCVRNSHRGGSCRIHAAGVQAVR
jgi:hypothetical protein